MKTNINKSEAEILRQKALTLLKKKKSGSSPHLSEAETQDSFTIWKCTR